MGIPILYKCKNCTRTLVSVVLIIIPCLLFVTSLETIQTRNKSWYSGGYDPEYAYLLNSLNTARFRLPGHIDHPGTTTQVAGGIVLEGAWLIDPRGENLTQSVLTEPEHYIRVLNIATAIIGSLALYIFALFLYHRTRNIWYSLLLQLTPFVSGFLLFNGFTRVTQEVMQMIAGFAMATVALIWFFDPHHKDSRKYIILFGIIAGFGMASKVLFAPLLIIPLVLLKNFRHKIMFVALSIIAFVFFTLPILKMYPHMLNWFYQLFIHSGQYGSGNTEIIDSSKYFNELLNLFIINPVLAAIFGFSVLILIGLIINKLIKRGEPFSPMSRLFLAVVLAQSAGYLLIAKQPKAAYLLPYESVAAINVVLIVCLISSFFKSKYAKTGAIAIITATLMILGIPYGITQKETLYSSEHNVLMENGWQAAISAPGRKGIICSNPGSSPVAGLYFGNAYSIRRYSSDLQQIYQDYYILDTYNNNINQWDGVPIEIETLFAKYKEQLYIVGSENELNSVRELLQISDTNWKMSKIYDDGYQIIMAPVRRVNGKFNERKLIFCGAESLPADTLEMVKCDDFSFTGSVETNKYFSGMSGVNTALSPYAFTVKPQVLNLGDSLHISVMASGNPDDLRIIFSSEGSNEVYIPSEGPTPTDKKEWSLIQMQVKVNEEMAGKSYKAYAWNKGNSIAYFDNFRMERFSPAKNDTLNGSSLSK